MSQTGVGPYSHNEDIKVKAYYQWVPFVLFLQVTISSLYSLSCLATTHSISIVFTRNSSSCDPSWKVADFVL